MTDRPDASTEGGEALAKVIDLRSREQMLSGARVTYTVAEVANLLGISRATTYALLRRGEIPARRIGSRWIIACKRFNSWLDSDSNGVDR
jgi:excisionase family DNA binding protein